MTDTGLDLGALKDRMVPMSVIDDPDWRALDAAMLAARDEQEARCTLESFLLPRWRAVRDRVREHDPAPRGYAGWMQHLALRAIGATHADPARARGLAGKQHLKNVIAAYENFREGGRLPATYEVIYAHAWGPPPGQPRRSRGVDIATFPVDQLRVRQKP